MSDNQLMNFLRTAVRSLNEHVSHPQVQYLMGLASQNFEISDIYLSTHSKVLHTPVIYLAMSSHSTCLGAYITAFTGHVNATTSISRTALEAALYAYGISKNNDLLEKWRNPPQDRRNRINAAVCLRLLKANHPGEFDEAALLYEDCIASGAHPTRSSLFQTSNVHEHLFRDNHTYTGPVEFTVDAILEPCKKSIKQLVFAIAIHAYCLKIVAVADTNHPRSSEIVRKADELLLALTDYLQSNTAPPISQ